MAPGSLRQSIRFASPKRYPIRGRSTPSSSLSAASSRNNPSALSRNKGSDDASALSNSDLDESDSENAGSSSTASSTRARSRTTATKSKKKSPAKNKKKKVTKKKSPVDKNPAASNSSVNSGGNDDGSNTEDSGGDSASTSTDGDNAGSGNSASTSGNTTLTPANLQMLIGAMNPTMLRECETLLKTIKNSRTDSSASSDGTSSDESSVATGYDYEDDHESSVIIHVDNSFNRDETILVTVVD